MISILKFIKTFAIVLTFFFTATASPVWSKPPLSPCNKQIDVIDKKKNAVNDEGGLWALFEKKPDLSKYSSEALLLESKVNEVIFVLRHLCNTQDGVPLNDLAGYVSRHLQKDGPAKFRQQLITFGKTDAEIDLWFKFAEFAEKNKSRTLAPEKVLETVTAAETFVYEYVNLFANATNWADEELLLQARELSHLLDQFKTENPCFSIGVMELGRVPRWDISESVGGS